MQVRIKMKQVMTMYIKMYFERVMASLLIK